MASIIKKRKYNELMIDKNQPSKSKCNFFDSLHSNKDTFRFNFGKQ